MIKQNHKESNTEKLITKRSRLENVISKITKNIDHSFTLSQYVIEKLKHDIKNNKSADNIFAAKTFRIILNGKTLLYSGLS